MRADETFCGRALAALAPLALPVLLAGCTLQEVALAPPEDVLVAEVVLQAGAGQQLAWLHRTVGGEPLAVPGATVRLTLPGGAVVAFEQTAGSRCVNATRSFYPDTTGTCYATPLATSSLVVPGNTYTLAVRAADGRALAGTTTVPGAFALTSPGGMLPCYLAPGRLLPLSWTRSAGAWVYMSETRLTHVRRALDPSSASDAALDMLGLSISAEDTTIVFPSQFGLFDRFDDQDAAVLVALQKGLPAGVTASVTVAAADRNFVQWVRQDTFNPSGQVQIPSLHGDGTGVFGSLVPVRFDLTSASDSGLPPCTS